MAPSKKPKGKQNDEITSAEAQQGMVDIDHGRQVSEQLLSKVHSLHQACPPSCGAKGSKASKDNPQCFCYLVPPEGSYRKKGLWQKETVVGEMGRDPAEDKRKAPCVPAGLRNLGNTCYVNAAMQFLFANPDFNHSLYMVEPEIAAQDIVRQLRDLCIDHHFGPRSYADPAPFATVLQLNTAVQQDGQEFLKLLLQKLEHIFASSQQREVSSVVQRLFRGYFSYVTTCRNCHQSSAGSARETEYYELPLQVVGRKSLQESMSHALASEELVGDNQYFCDYCDKKCDAERQMRLRSLPPYLCLSLQRFVFDIQTMDKKKASDKVSIPVLLDVGQVIEATGVTLPQGAPDAPDGSKAVPGASCSQYELAAVLIHRGTSASHGHYVAHIKLPDTGIWWRFDDEVAEEMGPTPTKFPPADHGTTAQAQAATNGAAAGEDSKAKPGGGKGKRSRKDDDSDYEAPAAAASKKGRGAGGRGRGRRGKGRGRGKKQTGSAGSADAELAQQMTEEDQMQEALRLSREAEQQEQATAWATVQQQQDQPQQPQQQPQQHELNAVDDEAASKVAVKVGGKGSKKRRNAAAPVVSESGTAKKPARERECVKPAEEPAAAAAAAAAPGCQAAAVAEQTDASKQVDIVSGNAYFVVYRQRSSSAGSSTTATASEASPTDQPVVGVSTPADSTAGDGQLAASLEAAGNDAVPVRLDPQVLQQLQQLPDDVHQRVQQLHQEFDQACRTHRQIQQEAVARVIQRQKEIRPVHQLLQVPDDHLGSGCFLPSAWLESWANNADSPGHIDNGQLLCEHGKLKLDKPGVMKYISKAAWEALVADHKGNPCLTLIDTCPTCLRTHLQSLVRSDYLLVLRDELLDCLATDEQQHDTETGVGYYVSKSWLTGFKHRQRIGGGSLQPPTAGITCCHGHLAPEALSPAAKRVLVSAVTWGKLRELWVTQVLREVASRRNKTAKQAAAKELAAPTSDGEANGVVISDDDSEGPQRSQRFADRNAAAAVVVQQPSGKTAQQQQVELEANSDAMHVDLVDDVQDEPVILSDDNEQQQQAEQCDGQQRTGSPEAAAAAAPPAWQSPLPLDGSVELTEQQLVDVLPEFHSVHAEECPECAASLQVAAAGHQEVKQQLEVQRAAFGKLLSGTVQEVLEPGVTYYLVPSEWVNSLRAYMSVASSRKASSAGLPPQPTPLPDAIRALLCTCHPDKPGLVVPLPEIVNRRGRFSQSDPLKDALRVVTQQDWQQLMLYYSGLPDSNAVTAQQRDMPLSAAADLPAGKRLSRGRGRASKQQQEQQQQQQEQLDVLQQLIASMADVDVACRGISAFLCVHATEPASAAAAAPPVQQNGQQLGQQLAKQDQQQQAQAATEQEALEGQQEAAPEEGQQQQVCLTEQQQQQGEEQQEQQQQQQVNGECNQQHMQQHVQARMEAEPVDLDVVVCSPPHQQQQGLEVASVDLTCQSPTAMQPQAAADTIAVQVMQQAAPAAATTKRSRSGSTESCKFFDIEDDSNGLVEAAVVDNEDWKPGTPETDKLASTRRGTRRGTAAAASRGRAGGGDSEGSAGAAATSAASSLTAFLISKPGLCQAVLDARAAQMRAAMLVYTDAEVMVEVIQKADLPTAFTNSVGDRRSRRARKDRQPVKVSSTDTLAQLRLKVFDALYIHPKNQKLYARGAQIQGDQQTLAQLELFPDEEIRVMNTNEVPDDDYASLFDAVATGKKKREVETGFRDTALLSSALQPGAQVVAAGQPAGSLEQQVQPMVANMGAETPNGTR